MATQPLFRGLIYDEQDNLCETGFVGQESHYIIDDDGFQRYVPSEEIDRKILALFLEQLNNNQDLAVEQALNMMGKDDLLTKAALVASIRNVSEDEILKQGIPQQAIDMMGMMGFKVIVNYRGEIQGFNQPTVADDEGW